MRLISETGFIQNPLLGQTFFHFQQTDWSSLGLSDRVTAPEVTSKTDDDGQNHHTVWIR